MRSIRLIDEAIRITVGLRLGLILRGTSLSMWHNSRLIGIYGLSCKRSTGCSTRHHQINHATRRALKRANGPATKEHQRTCSEAIKKRSDGLTSVPWQSGRRLTWDVIVVDTLTNSYTSNTSVTIRGTAEAAAMQKSVVIQSHIFVPIAIETLGPFDIDGQRLFDSLGERLSSISSDPSEISVLYQNISVLYQVFNLVAFRGSSQPRQ